MADQQQQQTPPPAPAQAGQAAQQPAAPTGPQRSWPPVAERVLIGKSIKRLDGPGKAAGEAKYTYDIIAPGHALRRVLGSPHPHARDRSASISPPRRKLPGVQAAFALIEDRGGSGEARTYQGEEIAAVAAVTEEQSREDAVRLIKVDYEVLPHLATVEQAMRPDAPLVFEKGNVTEAAVRQEGDVEAGLKTAGAHRRRHLLDAGADAHQPRDARRRLRVGTATS